MLTWVTPAGGEQFFVEAGRYNWLARLDAMRSDHRLAECLKAILNKGDGDRLAEID
jgi:hypothetical protein